MISKSFLCHLIISAVVTWVHCASAQSFMPLPAASAKFAGTHWREGNKDRPLQAVISVQEVGKGSFGTAIELRVDTSDKERVIGPFQWVITPEAAVYDVWFGEANADLKQWISGSSKPDLTLGNLRVPVIEADSGRFADPKIPKVSASHESYLWSEGLRQCSIRENRAHDVLRYATFHEGNSNFTSLVWQRGVGLVRMALGSGAHRDGYELDRVFEPAGNIPESPDVLSLFALLPSEAMPSLGAMETFVDPALRQQLVRDAKALPKSVRAEKLDRAHGFLSFCSNTDGEGDVLEVALWKRKDGASLLGLHVKHWTAGPESTHDARLYEFRGGSFRLATFSSWLLPEPTDFYSSPESQANNGPLIEGDWHLPQTGTTIRIRPDLEDDEEMLDDVKCTADQALELRWNGKRFESVPVPRKAKWR